jgi:hypothetical protein
VKTRFSVKKDRTKFETKNNFFGSTQFETMNLATPSLKPEPFLLNQSAWSSTGDYRVAAIFPEHFQSFTVALNINLFTNYFALSCLSYL